MAFVFSPGNYDPAAAATKKGKPRTGGRSGSRRGPRRRKRRARTKTKTPDGAIVVAESSQDEMESEERNLEGGGEEEEEESILEERGGTEKVVECMEEEEKSVVPGALLQMASGVGEACADQNEGQQSVSVTVVSPDENSCLLDDADEALAGRMAQTLEEMDTDSDVKHTPLVEYGSSDDECPVATAGSISRVPETESEKPSEVSTHYTLRM